MHGMKKTLVVGSGIVLLFAAGLLFHRAFVRLEDRRNAPPFSSMRAARNAIVVRDQSATATVAIELVTLIDPAFVVLHDDEQGPGRVLGYTKLLLPGSAQGLRLTPSERLAPGYYYAVLHADDRDGVYEPAADAPLREEDGDIVMGRFLVLPEGAGTEE